MLCAVFVAGSIVVVPAGENVSVASAADPCEELFNQLYLVEGKPFEVAQAAEAACRARQAEAASSSSSPASSATTASVDPSTSTTTPVSPPPGLLASDVAWIEASMAQYGTVLTDQGKVWLRACLTERVALARQNTNNPAIVYPIEGQCAAQAFKDYKAEPTVAAPGQCPIQWIAPTMIAKEGMMSALGSVSALCDEDDAELKAKEAELQQLKDELAKLNRKLDDARDDREELQKKLAKAREEEEEAKKRLNSSKNGTDNKDGNKNGTDNKHSSGCKC
jgi:septal ring factor EnvC (AmiA/AmiB activator)